MNPIKFPGHNAVIAKDQPPYLPLPARFLNDKMGTCVMCFELTDEDLAVLNQTKKLWVTCLTFTQLFQPIMLTTDKPQWSLPGQVDIVRIDLMTKHIDYTNCLAIDSKEAEQIVFELNFTNPTPDLFTFAQTRSDIV